MKVCISIRWWQTEWCTPTCSASRTGWRRIRFPCWRCCTRWPLQRSACWKGGDWTNLFFPFSRSMSFYPFTHYLELCCTIMCLVCLIAFLFSSSKGSGSLSRAVSEDCGGVLSADCIRNQTQVCFFSSTLTPFKHLFIKKGTMHINSHLKQM